MVTGPEKETAAAAKTVVNHSRARQYTERQRTWTFKLDCTQAKKCRGTTEMGPGSTREEGVPPGTAQLTG
jgi:hypothetical protein